MYKGNTEFEDRFIGEVIVAVSDRKRLSRISGLLEANSIHYSCVGKSVPLLHSAMRLNPGAIVLDLELAGAEGLDILPVLKRVNPDVPLIVVSEDPSEETQAAAMGYSLHYYLIEPIRKDDFILAVTSALEFQERRSYMASLVRMR
jgi:two-component system, NtrC family, nitrogen regulation response regulator NtrX